MTPVERWEHLLEYWNNKVKMQHDEWKYAALERNKYRDKLEAAEIAETMAKEINK